jgi:predicted aconitase with swiveling domain
VLLEAARAGTAPAAIVTSGVDSFLALASIVAGEMYGTVLPVLAVTPEDFGRLRTGDWVRIETDGQLWLI